MDDADASAVRRGDAAGQPWSRLWAVLASGVVGMVLCCAGPGTGHAAAAPSVIGVRIGVHDGWTRLVLELTAQTSYHLESDAGANRIRLDLPGLTGTPPAGSIASDGLIRRCSFEKGGDHKNRLVIDTTGPVRVRSNYEMEATNGRGVRLVLDLVPDTAGAAAPRPSAVEVPPASEVAPASEGPPAVAVLPSVSAVPPSPGPSSPRLPAQHPPSGASPVPSIPKAVTTPEASREPNSAGPSSAITRVTPSRAGCRMLEEALALAIATSPTLGSARANLRASEEGLTGARAQARPETALTATTGLAVSKGGIAGTSEPSAVASGTSAGWVRTHPRTVGVSVTQPLYRGGQIDAGISQARNAVLAQEASFRDSEQTLLLQAATAWLDVAADQMILALLTEFETFQKRDLRALQDRYRAGEVTASDVSLQEAQVASASAARMSGKGTLDTDTATYTTLIGEPPGPLSLPLLTYALPSNLNEAIEQAQADSPRVIAAKFAEASAQDTVDVATGALLPNLSLVGSVSRSLDRSVANDFNSDASLVASLTIPLDNGTNAAKVRAAQDSVGAARLAIVQALRTARESTTTAWNVLTTTRANIAFYGSAVKANEQAAKGIRQLIAIGAATIIDLLSTEQTLLNARISLVRAHHDQAAAVFSMLAAIGRLTPETLGLAGPDEVRAARDP